MVNFPLTEHATSAHTGGGAEAAGDHAGGRANADSAGVGGELPLSAEF